MCVLISCFYVVFVCLWLFLKIQQQLLMNLYSFIYQMRCQLRRFDHSVQVIFILKLKFIEAWIIAQINKKQRQTNKTNKKERHKQTKKTTTTKQQLKMWAILCCDVYQIICLHLWDNYLLQDNEQCAVLPVQWPSGLFSATLSFRLWTLFFYIHSVDSFGWHW